jgi:hypothetical protein
MRRLAARRLLLIGASATLVFFPAGCGSESPAAPTPVQQTESFTGTLQPLGFDFKTFTINYTQTPTDLSVSVNSLTTVAGATSVTGITIGVGVGSVSGSSCAMQLQTGAAMLGQELFAPNGASAGNYCVQIFDCPTGSTGCTSTLTEAVTYSITVKHF